MKQAQILSVAASVAVDAPAISVTAQAFPDRTRAAAPRSGLPVADWAQANPKNRQA